MSEPIDVGIDIAKASFDLAMTGKTQTLGLGNDESGHAKLCQQLEATEGYDQVLALPLIAAGLWVSVVNPRQARDFARCMGKLGCGVWVSNKHDFDRGFHRTRFLPISASLQDVFPACLRCSSSSAASNASSTLAIAAIANQDDSALATSSCCGLT